MGRGCYDMPMRQLFVAGTQCDNHCFPHHGGCKADDPLVEKKYETCEYAPEWEEYGRSVDMGALLKAVTNATAKGESIFIYTPDMFSDLYFDAIFKKLPEQSDRTYIAINACVKTFIDRKVGWEALRNKGIKEVWFGVESGARRLRDLYNKLPFTNGEIIGITLAAKDAGVNVCWFLVDGHEDNGDTRLQTFNLIKEGNPFRVNIEQLRRQDQSHG